MSSISITLDNPLAEYRAGAMVTGAVHILTRSAMAHNGIVLSGSGLVGLRPSKAVFNGQAPRVKPLSLLDFTMEVRPAGRLPEGASRLDFEFYVVPVKKPGVLLLESYSGAFMFVQYMLAVEVKTGAFTKALKCSVELIVQVPGQGVDRQLKSAPVPFAIDSRAFDEVGARRPPGPAPRLDIVGHLETAVLDITRPVAGTLTIRECSLRIVTIDIYLIRIEGIQVDGETAFETSYVQTTQLACSDVCRNLPIPIWMQLPRVFSCPNLSYDAFRLLWHVELVVFFEEEGACVRKVIPVSIFRKAAS
eukprot:EG_transcript_15612